MKEMRERDKEKKEKRKSNRKTNELLLTIFTYLALIVLPICMWWLVAGRGIDRVHLTTKVYYLKEKSET